jgi:hypothetical protein
MLSPEESDILEKADKILKKKRRQKEENDQILFENKKRKIYGEEMNKLLDKKQKLLNEIENVDKHLEEYKQVYLRGTRNAIFQVEKEIEKMGKYTGQCLHKEKEIARKKNFDCYDGVEEYYVCKLCRIRL